MITGHTKLYAIIGDPVTHVRTPEVFNVYFAEHNIDAVCVAICIPAEEINAGLAGLKAMTNFDGFIVTSPHKTRVAEALDRLEGHSGLINAVNTVRRDQDGELAGTLLDGLGFVAGLKRYGHEIAGKSVYIRGAGGAASAISFALADGGIGRLAICNRTLSRAEGLLARVKARFPKLEVAVRTDSPAGFDIVVNATPVGLEEDDPLPFDVGGLDQHTVCAEVLMKPETTAMLHAAAARGCQTHQGKHMLNNQLDLMMHFFGLGPGTPET